ncbi:hypothetical protein DUI87_13339 [Hirundo rustica rustica]|uniref:Uncharacterized protein n=1 Tax=Hirundo rustica rustica TaxID=333673 RepID=A0A3M0KH02_HIRRU|nr:hypothetical protein DUI87_13339 [Hirundo rustica rustica]
MKGEMFRLLETFWRDERFTHGTELPLPEQLRAASCALMEEEDSSEPSPVLHQGEITAGASLLPREVVTAPSLETFRVSLDRALSNIFLSKNMAGGLELVNFKCPTQTPDEANYREEKEQHLSHEEISIENWGPVYFGHYLDLQKIFLPLLEDHSRYHGLKEEIPQVCKSGQLETLRQEPAWEQVPLRVADGSSGEEEEDGSGREGRMEMEGEDGSERGGWKWKGRMEVEGKDGSGREKDGNGKEEWKWKGRMEMEGEDGSGREGSKWKGRMEVQGGWKQKRRMMAGGASSHLKIEGALMKRRNTSGAKAEKHESPELQAGDLICFEKMSTSAGLIKKY